MRKRTYEWIVVSSKGEDLCLTEEQFQAYQDNREEGVVSFRNFEINPSFVVKAFKRPAETLFELYPCKNCGQNGWIIPSGKSGSTENMEDCSVCGGTGININV